MNQADWTCTLKESGIFPYVAHQISIRPYPFPYRAALSIVNDSTGIDEDAFEDWHQAPAGREIEVGDSLFFDADFNIAGGGRRIELARHGLIDGLCAYPQTGVAQAQAALAKADVKLGWYAGKQAISDAIPFEQNGIRYFSDGFWVEDRKFGDHRDYRVPNKLDDAVGLFKLCYLGGHATAEPFAPLTVLSRLDEGARHRFLIEWFNKTLVRDTSTSDGQRALFKRYRGGFDPSANWFPAQMRSLFLDRLTQSGGVLMLAQKFGDWSLIGRRPEIEQRRPAQVPVFDVHELTCWDDIADRFKKKMLWVAMPSRILRWLELRETLRFSSEEVDGKLIITIQGELLDNGRCVPVSAKDLNGIAFTIPIKTPEVHVVTEWSASEIPVQRDKEPMLFSHDCVFINWDPLIWPAVKHG